MTIIKELNVNEAVSKMNTIDGFVAGKILPLPVETGSSFSNYLSELNSTAVTTNSALTTETKQDAKLRAEAAYASAIARDSKYGLMGRYALLELGIHNMFREAYQVSKTGIDCEDSGLE